MIEAVFVYQTGHIGLVHLDQPFPVFEQPVETHAKWTKMDPSSVIPTGPTHDTVVFRVAGKMYNGRPIYLHDHLKLDEYTQTGLQEMQSHGAYSHLRRVLRERHRHGVLLDFDFKAVAVSQTEQFARRLLDLPNGPFEGRLLAAVPK